MMQPEAKIVKKIQDRIAERGGRSFKIWGSDGGFQEIGIPDLLVCYQGFFLGLEVKQPGEKASPIQRQVLKTIEAAGGVARVVCSVEEVDEILDQVISPVTLAWIAGFFDGEGCITMRPSPFHEQCVRLTISQKDPTPLLEISKVLGMGRLAKTQSGVSNLQIGKQKAVARFLQTVGPYLRLRHRRLKVEEACDILGIDSPEYQFPALR
jgi:hypothetical protein